MDPNRIGSYGISMGGITTVVVAAIEPRIATHVVALAGGPITDIMVASKDKLVAKPRNKYLARNHMTVEDLRTQLSESVRTDPVALARYVDPQRVFMFMAVFDHTIGRDHALTLWHALREPKAVFMPAGHYTSYLLLPYLKYESLRRLKKELGS